MDDQVDEAAKSERLSPRAAGQSTKARRLSIHAARGRTLPVLFERPGCYGGQLVGRSPYLQPPQVEAPSALIGEIAAVTITEVASNSLFGALAQRPPQEPAAVPALLGTGA